jgi:uridine phosphorylase
MPTKEFPILEYDDQSCAVIRPENFLQKMDVPEHAVICFFNDVIETLREEGKVKLIINLRSEMGNHPVYEMEHAGERLAVFHPGVGAPLAAGLLEEVMAIGCRKFIACGGAGVLRRDIAVGCVILPDSAVRDEGTSYHYLPPAREVQPSKEALDALEATLARHGCSYLKGKTWTTDAMYRETLDKVEQRRQEGCLAVEMECSALCAVALHQNALFAQLLFGGDDVSCEEWDSRQWNSRTDIRRRLFVLAAEACLML